MVELFDAEFPSDTEITTLTAVGRWVDADLIANTGYCTFNLVEPLTDPVSSLIIQPKEIMVWLDGTGAVAQSLLVALGDDGTDYYIRQSIVGAPPQFGKVTLNQSMAGRVVSDAVLVEGSNVITSATAAFTSDDVGAYLGSLLLPPLTQIASITNGTTVATTGNATTTASGVTLLIDAAFQIADVPNQ